MKALYILILALMASAEVITVTAELAVVDGSALKITSEVGF